MALRFDISSLRKPERLADGRLRADAYLTRTGVFEYRRPDGTVIREYRPPTEVFKADAMGSFADVVVTDDHPPELVTSRNARQYAVGMLSGAPRQDGEHVAATLIVIDEAAILKMDGGKVQLSCGYECDLVPTAGTSPNGERYDAIQTNIRGNHVALVDVGRAGPTARVRMDASQMLGPAAHEPKENTVNETELKAALEAATKRADAEKARADEAQAKLDAFPPKGESDDEDGEDDKKPAFLKKKLKKADERIAALEGELVTAKNDARDAKLRADAAEKARTDAADASMAAARARIALETTAAAVLGAEFKADASDRDLMVAVVKRVDGEDIGADASMDFVRGMFAGATKRHDGGADALAGLRLVTAPRTDATSGNESPEIVAQRKMNADSANAWKASPSKEK